MTGVGPKYPKIVVKITSRDGNAFHVLGVMRRALLRGGVPNNEVRSFLKEAMSGDYNKLLKTCQEWVTIK